jgi:hypothetical protein
MIFSEDMRRTIVCKIIDATIPYYKGADKSLARPGRKQATATEDSDVHISYL